MYQVFSGHFYSLCSSKIAHFVIYKCIWCIWPSSWYYLFSVKDIFFNPMSIFGLFCVAFANSNIMQSGKPRGRQPKVPKHSIDNSVVINITDDSSSDSDGIDTDSNSSPDSLLDNDDVIFVNQTSYQTGRHHFFFCPSACVVSNSDTLEGACHSNRCTSTW